MFLKIAWYEICQFRILLNSYIFLLHSHLFQCYFFALLSSSLTHLNRHPGENRGPLQSVTNCFVRFTNPEPNPDKRTLVKTAVLFVYAWVTYWCLIKVFIVLLCCACGRREGPKPCSTSKQSQMLWAQMKLAPTVTDKEPLLWGAVVNMLCKFGLLVNISTLLSFTDF